MEVKKIVTNARTRNTFIMRSSISLYLPRTLWDWTLRPSLKWRKSQVTPQFGNHGNRLITVTTRSMSEDDWSLSKQWPEAEVKRIQSVAIKWGKLGPQGGIETWGVMASQTATWASLVSSLFYPFTYHHTIGLFEANPRQNLNISVCILLRFSKR